MNILNATFLFTLKLIHYVNLIPGFFFRKDHILRHMKFKNTRDKEKILKIVREKQRISYCIINHNKLNNNIVINKP